MWKCYRDEPNHNITESESFKFKIKIAGKTSVASNTKDAKIMLPLKYLSNFWTTLEMLLINCEISLILSCFDKFALSNDTKLTTFAITDTKLYVPAATLSTQDNAKLLEQLRSGFKRIIDWNKYQSKVLTERENQYLGFLIDLRFQGVNRLLALSFENEDHKKVHTGYYHPKVEIKDYNIMFDGTNFLISQLNVI